MATSLQDHVPLSTMSQEDLNKFFYLNDRIRCFLFIEGRKRSD